MAPLGHYEFRVAERLSPTVIAAFPELAPVPDDTARVLAGTMRDRSQLQSILDRFQLMGLTLVDVHRVAG